MAVIQDDANGVEHILKRTPGSIAEIDVFGQTPFHLAAAKAWILEILLDYGDCNILDRRDLSGFTALETAMVHSIEYCRNAQNISDCDSNEYECCMCLDLLFGAQCSVRMHKLTETDHAPELHVFLMDACGHAQYKYVQYMERRQVSAMRSPSSSPYASTKSSDCESNKEVTQVERKVTSSPGQRKLSSMHDVADDMSWVFLEINDHSLGELFYNHGFKPHPFCLNHLRNGKHIYLVWLVSHAVDPFFRSSKGPAPIKDNPNIGLFGVHFAFYFMSMRQLPLPYNDQLGQVTRDDFVALTRTVCRQNLTDGCVCHCTIDGCSPFTWMMKGNFLSFAPQSAILHIHDWDIDTLVSYYMLCSLELTSLTYRAAIRYATFVALGLVHTCCKPGELIRHEAEWVEGDDVNTTNEEQVALLEVLEVLVNEFEEKASEFMKPDSSGNSSFPQFWILCWKIRMTEELQTLGGKELTDEERRGAEDIGVRWQIPEEVTEKENPYNQDDPQYWFYELDKTCPEYVEPWPEELRPVAKIP